MLLKKFDIYEQISNRNKYICNFCMMICILLDILTFFTLGGISPQRKNIFSASILCKNTYSDHNSFDSKKAAQEVIHRSICPKYALNDQGWSRRFKGVNLYQDGLSEVEACETKKTYIGQDSPAEWGPMGEKFWMSYLCSAMTICCCNFPDSLRKY